MQDRVNSSSVLAMLDAGHQTLPWPSPPTGGIFAAVDFQKILASEDPSEVVQALPPQIVYLSLKREGLNENLEILKYLSADQVTRILDYDTWSRDGLIPRKAMEWLKPYGEFGPEVLGQRFHELEEEYQLAILDKKIFVFDDQEYEDLPQNQQDRCLALPGNKLFYIINTEDEVEYEFIEALIKSCVEGEQMEYAHMLLAHAGYQPTHEAEDTLQQFRKARLEEDGFVTEEESQQLFYPEPLPALGAKAPDGRASALLPALNEGHESFFDQALRQAQSDGWDLDALFNLHQGLLYLANSLTVSARLETDDIKALNRIMEQAKGAVSLGLEWLSGGDVTAAVDLLRKQSLKSLFKVGLSAVDTLRSAFAERVQRHTNPAFAPLLRLLKLRRYGALLWHIDTELVSVIGQEYSEIVKGIYNRFPMILVKDGGENAARGLQFKPLASLAELRRAWALLNGLSGALSLQEKAEIKPGEALSNTFATAAMQYFAGRAFRAEALSQEEKIGSSWSSAEWSGKSAGLFAFLEQSLLKQQWEWLLMAEWGDVSQAISAALGVVGDTILGLEVGANRGDTLLPHVSYVSNQEVHS